MTFDASSSHPKTLAPKMEISMKDAFMLLMDTGNFTAQGSTERRSLSGWARKMLKRDPKLQGEIDTLLAPFAEMGWLAQATTLHAVKGPGNGTPRPAVYSVLYYRTEGQGEEFRKEWMRANPTRLSVLRQKALSEGRL